MSIQILFALVSTGMFLGSLYLYIAWLRITKERYHRLSKEVEEIRSKYPNAVTLQDVKNEIMKDRVIKATLELQAMNQHVGRYKEMFEAEKEMYFKLKKQVFPTYEGEMLKNLAEACKGLSEIRKQEIYNNLPEHFSRIKGEWEGLDTLA